MSRRSSFRSVEGKSLCFAYNRKQKTVIENVDITVAKGFIYGLLGPSGCGKTTLLSCITGLLKPSSGIIRVFGKIPGEAGFFIPGKGVGYMPQDLALYLDLSVEETLTFFGRLYQMSHNEVAERIDFLVSLLDIPDKKSLIRDMSGGQKRRVSFATALVHKPPLLILDEPTVGVDPLLRKSIWQHLKYLTRKDNLTVMVTTHYIEEARQADEVGFMREGRLLVQMNPELLLQRHNVFTLEDVFLKLCMQDAYDRGKLETKDRFYINEGCTDDDQQYQEAWKSEESDNKSLALRELSVVSEEANHCDVALPKDIRYDVDDIYHNPSTLTKLKESMTRMFSFTAKRFIRLKRHIVLSFIEIIMPLLQMTFFCLCIGGEINHLPMAVVNMDRHSINYSQQFLYTLSNKTFQQKYYPNLSSAIESVKGGENWGAVYIEPTFSERLIQRFSEGSLVTNETILGSKIHLYLDMTNKQMATAIHTNLVKHFQEFYEKMLQAFGYNTSLSEASIVLEDPIYGKKEPSFTEFMAPGIMLSIIYIMALGATATTVIMEKRDGVLNRCLVAGMTAGEMIFSILLFLFILVFIQVTEIIGLMFVLLDIQVVNSIAWVFVCTLFVGLSGITLGLLISFVCPDGNSAMVFVVSAIFPNAILSGILWPLEAMPVFLRYISYALPMTLMTQTLRSLLYRGWGILEHDTWYCLPVSISWSAALILLTWVVLKCQRYK